MPSSNSSNNGDDLLGRELLDPPTFLKTRDFPFLEETAPELIDFVLNLPEMIRQLCKASPKRKLMKKTGKHVKKRKMEENGVGISGGLTAEDSRKILHPFTRDQLLEIVQTAVLRHADVLDAVRSVADRDPAQRKLLIHGLGWDTSTEKLRSLFAQYGELEEASVVLDEVTAKCYGFITFKHTDGALQALREPRKQIDGRMAVAQLVGNGNNPVDVSERKIYVPNVPFDGRRGKPGMVGPVGGNGGHGYGVGAGMQGGSGQYGGYPGSMAVWQFGGPYGGGPGSAGYGGMGGGAGRGSFFGLPMPPSSGGFPGGDYQQSGAYNLSSSGFRSQHNQQPTGTSPAPRAPAGGLYQGANPYY